MEEKKSDVRAQKESARDAYFLWDHRLEFFFLVDDTKQNLDCMGNASCVVLLGRLSGQVLPKIG